MKKKIALIVCLVFIMTIIAGCGGTETEQTSNNGEDNQQVADTKENWPKGGSLGAASVGGTFYVWGAAWSKLVSDKIPEFPVATEVTGGPVHNIQLVEAGDLEFGLCSMPAAYDGWEGLRWADGQKYQKVRILFPMYPSYCHFWSLAKSGIAEGNDITGNVINLGPAGGTPDEYYRIMFDILGIEPGKIVNSGFSDMVGQLQDGIIDIGANTGGAPHGSVLETEATQPTNVFLFSEEQMAQIVEELPCFYLGAINKDVYECLEEDMPTLQYWNIMITNNDLPDSLAYEITKNFFENLESFKDVYAPTLDTVAEDILHSVIPIHPGAAKYYEEQGIEIPDELIVK